MALLQVSVMLTGLHSGDLMLGIECCRIFREDRDRFPEGRVYSSFC